MAGKIRRIGPLVRDNICGDWLLNGGLFLCGDNESWEAPHGIPETATKLWVKFSRSPFKGSSRATVRYCDIMQELIVYSSKTQDEYSMFMQLEEVLVKLLGGTVTTGLAESEGDYDEVIEYDLVPEKKYPIYYKFTWK